MATSALQPTRLALGSHLSDEKRTSLAQQAVAPVPIPPAPPPPGTEAAPAPPPPPPPPGTPATALIPGTPQDGGELGELAQEEYNLDETLALSLGFAVASVSGNGEHEVLVFQSARYKDVSFQGETYRFGVAIESTIVVNSTTFKGGLTLPAVAANVQLGFTSASSKLAVRGYIPTKPLTLPAWGSFDVGSYSAFQNTVSDLQTVLFDNANIHPVLLATTAPPHPDAPKPKSKHIWRL